MHVKKGKQNSRKVSEFEREIKQLKAEVNHYCVVAAAAATASSPSSPFPWQLLLFLQLFKEEL